MSNGQQTSPRYRRVLLKLSGEALMGELDFGFDPGMMSRVSAEIAEVVRTGVQIALVIGGGNIFRGAGLARAGLDRVTGDHMGMLATVINALAMQDSLGRLGVECRVMSAFVVGTICEVFDRRRALQHLDRGRVVIFAGGTGNPYFTTDSAASLRASEIGADLMLKATKVDGVYDADPVTHPDARRFDRITYNAALARNLGVMDTAALVICRDNHIPLRVFNMFDPGALVRVVAGDEIGTAVVREEQNT